MRGIVNYCDYFVISSGTSDRQVKAIASGIEDGLYEMGIKVRYKQGLDGRSRPRGFGVSDNVENSGVWGLMDMGDVVAHVFDEDSRDFYGLEHLWRQAPRTVFEE